jgi:hypothetical protein
MDYKVKIKKFDKFTNCRVGVKLNIVEESQLSELVEKFFRMDLAARTELLNQLN